jgi:hypothetical protein
MDKWLIVGEKKNQTKENNILYQLGFVKEIMIRWVI